MPMASVTTSTTASVHSARGICNGPGEIYDVDVNIPQATAIAMATNSMPWATVVAAVKQMRT